jgi:large subunit ribosomal protein L18
VFGMPDRPRLSVFRSLRHISAQLIDDVSGRTLCAAGSMFKSLSAQMKDGSNSETARVVGQLLGERARMQGIRQVTFDRNRYRYHGRVKALAEAARATGLEF